LKTALRDPTVVIVEEKDVRMGKPTVITGFPGPGLVGSVAVRYLTENLGMKKIAYVKSRLIPPIKAITANKLKALSPIRIYMNTQGDLLTMWYSPPSVISPAAYWDIAEALVNWLHRRTKEVIFLEGALIQEKAKPKVFAFCSNSRKLQDLRQHDIQPLSNGIIGGISAGMIDVCLTLKIPWVALLTTTTQLDIPDFQAATVLIDALNKILRLEVDTEPLLRAGKRRGRGKGLLRSLKRSVIGRS